MILGVLLVVLGLFVASLTNWLLGLLLVVVGFVVLVSGAGGPRTW